MADQYDQNQQPDLPSVQTNDPFGYTKSLMGSVKQSASNMTNAYNEGSPVKYLSNAVAGTAKILGVPVIGAAEGAAHVANNLAGAFGLYNPENATRPGPRSPAQGGVVQPTLPQSGMDQRTASFAAANPAYNDGKPWTPINVMTGKANPPDPSTAAPAGASASQDPGMAAWMQQMTKSDNPNVRYSFPNGVVKTAAPQETTSGPQPYDLSGASTMSTNGSYGNPYKDYMQALNQQRLDQLSARLRAEDNISKVIELSRGGQIRPEVANSLIAAYSGLGTHDMSNQGVTSEAQKGIFSLNNDMAKQAFGAQFDPNLLKTQSEMGIERGAVSGDPISKAIQDNRVRMEQAKVPFSVQEQVNPLTGQKEYKYSGNQQAVTAALGDKQNAQQPISSKQESVNALTKAAQDLKAKGMDPKSVFQQLLEMRKSHGGNAADDDQLKKIYATIFGAQK